MNFWLEEDKLTNDCKGGRCCMHCLYINSTKDWVACSESCIYKNSFASKFSCKECAHKPEYIK